MSGGNAQEHWAIRRTMRDAAIAITNDWDWFGPLMECHLHTVLSTGDVLPFSLALALVYEYPCTLGQQQPDLHKRLVYSSIYGIPLTALADPQGDPRVERRRERARRKAESGGRMVGYVSNTCTDDSTHRDEVRN